MSEKIMKNIPKLRFPEFLDNEKWEKKTLKELAENLDNKRVPITSNIRSKGDIPYYGASGIVDFVNDYIFDEELLCISEDGANLVARTYPIAFSISGKTWVNNHAHVLKFQNKYTQIIIENYLNSIKLDDFLTGMAQPKLNKAMLEIIPIPISPKPKEQQKIADCLSSIDSLISVQSQKVELLKEHKNGLLQKIFPKDGEDIPKIRFTEFLNSQEWKQKQLGSLTKVIVGGTPSTTESVYWNEGIINWLSSGDINNGIIKQASKLITPLGLEKSSAKLMPPDTVVLAMTGATLGRIGYLAIETSGNQSVAGLIPNREYNSKFLFYLLQKNTNTILSMAGGAAQAGINKATIESLEFYFPLINEQKKIADCLTSIDEEINLQIQKVESLKEHKKALLQQLFPSNEVING